MLYLLTAVGLSPGDSSTVQIYTQTIHRTTQIATNLEECGPCPFLVVVVVVTLVVVLAVVVVVVVVVVVAVLVLVLVVVVVVVVIVVVAAAAAAAAAVVVLLLIFCYRCPQKGDSVNINGSVSARSTQACN